MTRYYELPDYLSKKELEEYFYEFLITYGNTRENVDYALNELFELADRQWHTYEFLDLSIKEKIQNYLFNVINLESEENMECILVIIPRIGLKELFNYIVKEKDKIKNIEVVKEIDECIIEYTDHIDNPYCGM